MLLLSEPCKSSGHRSFLHLSISQYSSLSIRLLLGWLFKLNITVNCIDTNLSATEKKILCILVRCKDNVGHFIHTFGAQVWSNWGMYSSFFSRFGVFGCSWKLQWSMKGELVFLLLSQQRAHSQKRHSLCSQRDLPWSTLLYSLLQYNSRATNLEEQERKSIHELKIYCQVEQANNSFSTQFPFRCSQASLAELGRGNIHMKMKTNNSNSTWKAPTPEHSESCTAG